MANDCRLSWTASVLDHMKAFTDDDVVETVLHTMTA